MDSRDPRNNYQRRENLSRRRAAPERQEPLRKYVENDNPPVRARQRNSRQHEYENELKLLNEFPLSREDKSEIKIIYSSISSTIDLYCTELEGLIK